MEYYYISNKRGFGSAILYKTSAANLLQGLKRLQTDNSHPIKSWYRSGREGLTGALTVGQV
jgi:hypothetical protein